MLRVRRFRLSMTILEFSVVTIAGCEGLRQSLRPASEDKARALKTSPGSESSAIETDPTKVQAVDADAKNPRPFFSNNRRSGTWSSEAREIESHLGVGP
jgi:hypothetical protein